MNVSAYLQEGKLCVYPIQKPSRDDDPENLLDALAADLRPLTSSSGLVVVDCITNLAETSGDRAIIGFFSYCDRLCSEGRTLVVVSRSSAFDENSLVRLHAMCNTHISLGAEKIRRKSVKTLEVRKVSNTELNSDNMITFQVEPEVGIKILPMSRVKV